MLNFNDPLISDVVSIITESTDKPYSWQSTKDDQFTKYHFSSESNRFVVSIEHRYGESEDVTFSGNVSGKLNDESNALRVFATYIDIVEDYIKNNRPSSIHFTITNVHTPAGKYKPKVSNSTEITKKLLERHKSRLQRYGYKVGRILQPGRAWMTFTLQQI